MLSVCFFAVNYSKVLNSFVSSKIERHNTNARYFSVMIIVFLWNERVSRNNSINLSPYYI